MCVCVCTRVYFSDIKYLDSLNNLLSRITSRKSDDIRQSGWKDAKKKKFRRVPAYKVNATKILEGNMDIIL